MTEKRKAHRVVFDKGYAANMMAIDGTWRRPCTIVDVSDTGAKLTIDGPIDGLALTEFFLVLSSMGTAYRRCHLAWVNGNQVGVQFIRPGDRKTKRASEAV
jgi:PilZ domain-containing protein